jgi:DNA adenine methylase
LRCRLADGLGGTQSRDERQAPAPRLVLARFDGQRAQAIGAQVAFPMRLVIAADRPELTLRYLDRRVQYSVRMNTCRKGARGEDMDNIKPIQKLFPEFEAEPEAKKPKVVNVASVPHRSPFRYPGGKTWLVPYTRKWLASLRKKPKELAEVFAGGAIVGLSAIFDEQVERLTLVELDDDVAAVWKVIFGGQAREIAEAVSTFEMSRENVEKALAEAPKTMLERAFVTILRNRVQHSGILAPGASLMKRGENGKGLLSRWYADTLRKRILALGDIRDRVTFIHGDGIAYLRNTAHRNDVTFFVDPPYTVAGKRLYTHSDVDHDDIIHVASMAKGSVLVTYDDAQPIRELAARHGLPTGTIPMQNKRHAIQYELLIGRDLGWAQG